MMRRFSDLVRRPLTSADSLVFLGIPGAGKTTQARIIAARYGLRHISTGDLVRSVEREAGARGDLVRDIQARGGLVPDALMLELLGEALAGAGGVILDGYPRTLPQAHTLAQVVPSLRRAVYFDITNTVAWQRVLERQRDEHDDPKVLFMRTMAFYEHGAAVLSYYSERRLLTHILADQAVEAVTAEILQKIEGASASAASTPGERRT